MECWSQTNAFNHLPHCRIAHTHLQAIRDSPWPVQTLGRHSSGLNLALPPRSPIKAGAGDCQPQSPLALAPAVWF